MKLTFLGIRGKTSYFTLSKNNWDYSIVFEFSTGENSLLLDNQSEIANKIFKLAGNLQIVDEFLNEVTKQIALYQGYKILFQKQNIILCRTQSYYIIADTTKHKQEHKPILDVFTQERMYAFVYQFTQNHQISDEIKHLF